MNRSRAFAFVVCVALSQHVVAQPAHNDRRTYRESLEKARAAHDVRQQATAALLLGIVDMGAGDIGAARSDLVESRGAFEDNGDLAGVWFVSIALGEIEKQSLNYDGAVDAYRQAISALTKAAEPGKKFSLETLQSLSKVVGGAPTMQLPEGITGQGAFKPLFLLFAEVMTRDGYGSALLAQGDLAGAERELTRAQQQAGLFGGLFDAPLAVHRGDLRRRQWRFDDARREYLAALNTPSILPGLGSIDQRVQLNVLSQLADIEILSGHFDDALSWNDRALSMAVDDAAIHADVMHERGSLLFRMRRYDAAASAFDEALKLAESLGSNARKADIQTDIALLEMSRGRYGTAARGLESAIALFEKAGDTDGETSAWVLLSDVYTAMNAQSEAQMAGERAKSLAARNGSRVGKIISDLTLTVQGLMRGEGSPEGVREALAAFWSSPELADLMLTQKERLENLLCDPTYLGRLAVAGGTPVPMHLESMVTSINELLEAKTALNRGDSESARSALLRGLAANSNSDFTPAFLLLLGVTWARQGNLDRATESFEDAAATLEASLADIRVEDLLASYIGSGRNIYFDVLIEALIKEGRVAEAFEVSERARARAFLQMIGNARLNAKQGTDAEIIREAEALRLQIEEWEKSPLSFGERGRALDLRNAKERYAALLTQIKVSNPEYASMTTVSPSTISGVQGELSGDATLLSYYRTPWGFHAWIVSRSSVNHVLLPVKDSSTCWASEIAGVRGAKPVVPASSCGQEATAEAVYRSLFAPVRPYIHSSRIFIVAHGALHYVPFAALRDPVSGRYLVQDFVISYLPSASSLSFIREKESAVEGSAVVFGDPAAAGSDLPYAEQEARSVAAALGTTPLLGRDATEGRVYELAHHADLVHIAAHGTFDSDHPLFSSVVLAPDAKHDGRLEVHEILSSLDLSGVNLVVLAACDTAQGRRTSGDDVVGLTRAFLYAGTPGVVAALWSVRDDATAALMAEFYRRLLAGEPAADALRQAQIALLQGDRFATPRDWAAFGVYGDPQGRWTHRKLATSPHEGQ